MKQEHGLTEKQLSLRHDKPPICCGYVFYQSDDLAIHSTILTYILSLLRGTDLKFTKRDFGKDFIEMLIYNFYSFEKSESHSRTIRDRSVIRIETGIEFESIKNFGVDAALTMDKGDRD